MAEARGALQLSDATQEMLRLTGDMLDVGVLTVDRELRVCLWNKWLEAASGLSAHTVIGRPLSTVAPEMISPTGEAAFAKALGGGTVVHAHRLHGALLNFPAPPGHETYSRMQQSARIAPLTGSDGKIAGAVAFIEDVTDRAAGEDELRAAIKAAQAADRAKSDFLAAMSHELRTPIGAITGYADLLIDEILGPLNAAQREHLARVKGVGSHLLGIVDEILMFARLEARGETINVKRVDACEVVRDAASAVEPQAGKKGLRLTVSVPDDRVAMRTDETKLRQIVINLLGNAVKFTASGTITVDVSTTGDDGRVRISVSDTGSGIASDDIARIFEPFVQARSVHSRSHDGTGLGLSVSRQLARLLGGDITVESAVNEGSTFVVLLPAETEAPEQPARISLETEQHVSV